MVFFLLHPKPAVIPRAQTLEIEEDEFWLTLGGTLQDLDCSQRTERWLAPDLRSPTRGPAWLGPGRSWTPYTSVEAPPSHHADAPLFEPLTRERLIQDGSEFYLDPDLALELQRAATTFTTIAETLRATAPEACFLRDSHPIRPRPCDPSSFFVAEPSEADVLQRVTSARDAAMDQVAFVAWWTLCLPGWERHLDREQISAIRVCSFLHRKKKGCLVDLLFDYSQVNFELWINHGVPVYYLWNKALNVDPRFFRANPAFLGDYFDARGDGDWDQAFLNDRFNEWFLEQCKEQDLADITDFDNFFQSREVRSAVIDTPVRTYDASHTYALQAFQGWRPYILRDEIQINRLLANYEIIDHGGMFGCRITILRWAPRRKYMGSPDDEGYTADDGRWELEPRFQSSVYDKASGWISNDVHITRELLKLAYAPAPGRTYSPSGALSENSLTTMAERRKFEESIVEDYVRGWRSIPTFQIPDPLDPRWGEGTEEPSGGQQTGTSPERTSPLSLLERMGIPPIAEQTTDEDGALGAPHSNLTLAERLSSPPREQWRARRRHERHSFTGRSTPSDAGTIPRTPDLPVFAVDLALRGRERHRGTERRSQSPLGVTRAADPRNKSLTPYHRGHREFQPLFANLQQHLKILGRAILDSSVHPLAPLRRIAPYWDRDFLERGLVALPEPLDQLRVFLLPRLFPELDSPVKVLNRMLEGGMRVIFLTPRDPIPRLSIDEKAQSPSENSFAAVLTGKGGAELYRAWLALLQGLWERTHLIAYLTEGGVIAYVVRRFAPPGLLIKRVGCGVSLQNRALTRNTDTAPDGNIVVKDVMSEEERQLLGGMVAGATGESQPRWILPPQSIFDGDECDCWNLGSGEWGQLEEDYLDDILEQWANGKGVAKTRSEWVSHARQRRRRLVKQDVLLVRDSINFPDRTRARGWMELLQPMYDGLPLNIRAVSGLHSSADPATVVRFK
ncbi:hypothetical protein BD626DRAFT_574663 [Schizophyllum amplum]|uniref:Uncharacterized protein n=1 Tax=Schizophyllum amplum TaxID=97359 RepID=A0A550BXV5_9AGAR|nr:hypothetical protein BD626DRAFT_574663 [Auriculariopsis ampla]